MFCYNIKIIIIIFLFYLVDDRYDRIKYKINYYTLKLYYYQTIWLEHAYVQRLYYLSVDLNSLKLCYL
jgi:hypothetical protein